MARDPNDPGTRDLEGLTPIEERLIRANDGGDEPITDPAFHHVVMCQTTIPYRRTDQRRWWHRNGNALLWIEAGAIEDPQTAEPVDVPLPWGPKPRMLLAHLNGEALRQGTRHVEVEGTLTAFLRRVLGRHPKGRDMRHFREHLTALSAATVRMSYRMAEGRRFQTQGTVVEGMELWAAPDERQRTLWPGFVSFSQPYFDSLTSQAVPLDPQHVAALGHSAMALDIYAWLAQRLHRIRQPEGQFVPWSALHQQFGHGYSKLSKFREVFRRELAQVKAVYLDARVEEDIRPDGMPEGLHLQQSKPPVLRRG